MKNFIPSFEQFVNESVNEGAVKAFEMIVSELIQDVKRGPGWIDPDFVPDTFAFTAGGEDIEWDNSIAPEVYRRLIKAGVLWEANPDNPEEKGRKITSLSQIGIKESVNEGKEDFVPSTLVKDSGDLRKGQVVKVNALEYTKRGDRERVSIIRPDGKKADILRGDLSIKI